MAELALRRMAVDKNNEVTVFHTSDLESSTDDTYVASAISPEQQVPDTRDSIKIQREMPSIFVKRHSTILCSYRTSAGINKSSVSMSSEYAGW